LKGSGLIEEYLLRSLHKVAIIIEISKGNFHNRKLIKAVTQTWIYLALHGMGKNY
jgi:hypothetical protein